MPGRCDQADPAASKRRGLPRASHRGKTMGNQLTWTLFAYNPSKGETRALLKDMSTAFARNYLRALDCPQGTIDRFQ